MSFQGTRNKGGTSAMDWAAIGRGIGVQFVLTAVLAPVALVAGIQAGFAILLANVGGGVYVGFRTGNYGDEYMDGGAVGILGAIATGIAVGVVVIVVMGPITGQETRPFALFLYFLQFGGSAVIVLIPLGGLACAASAWFVARNFKE